MSLTSIIYRVHLWAGVILGLQVIVWMASGVVMTWFHIDLVRGERTAFSGAPLELEATAYASPGGVIAQSAGATRLELRAFLGRPVYEVQSHSGLALFDATSGEKLSPISESLARRVALADYVGDAEIETLALVGDPPPEYRGAVPVWRADFGDSLNTRLYISAETGEVRARRNDIWRIYDFFWMLHIMDYSDREDFNNPLVKITAISGLVFAISGVVMVFMKTGRTKMIADINSILRRRE